MSSSSFVPEKRDLLDALLLLFHLKKNASDSHQMLVEAYGEHALSEQECTDWFERFKGGDFSCNDKPQQMTVINEKPSN